MKYKCLIVDDEELARELIATHLSHLEEFEIIATCKSAIEAQKIVLQQKIDLIFLDIEMPALKGTEFFKNLEHKPAVIFTTAYRDYAIEGFELNAIDYLLKPITFERFFKSVNKFLSLKTPINMVVEEKQVVEQKSIFVRKDRKQVKILLEDILYVEGLKDYVKIHLCHEQQVVKHTLSSFEQLLDNRFLRIHKSFIINKDRISAYSKTDIEIGKIEIPIGEQYRAVVAKMLEE
jgi:two-component system, LytTR family, response regulator